MRIAKSIVFPALLLLCLSQTVFPQSNPSGTRFNRPRVFDAQHYRIELRFDRSVGEITARTTVRVRPLGEAMSRLQLDAENLKFTSVVDGDGAPLRYRTVPGSVIVDLGRIAGVGSDVTVTFNYTAKPKKGIYFIPPGSFNGRPRSAQIWTQGEPEEARHWFPAYDFPDDKATSEQIIRVESEDTVVANGSLVSETDHGDGTKTVHHRMDFPHSTYLVSFVVGRYEKRQRLYKSIPLTFFLYPGRTGLAEDVFAKTEGMMRIFENLTNVSYPFTKYDQTIVANFTFGGMENITATTLADRDVSFAESPIGAGLVEDLVSHELAHSWFGNLVTCRNWAELWLNEGMATFMEAAYRERAYGRDDYLRKIRQDVGEYLLDDMRRSAKHGLYNLLARPDDSIFNSVVYKKGGAVVHTLRETVGDEAFWRALTLYLNRHAGKNVETTDFQRVFEETSGRDLGWFFRQWVYGTGHPELRVSSSYSRSTKKLAIQVSQEHRAGGLTPSSFRLPLEFAVQTSSGLLLLRGETRKPIETFVFDLPTIPKSVAVDPGLKIPLKIVKSSRLRVR